MYEYDYQKDEWKKVDSGKYTNGEAAFSSVFGLSNSPGQKLDSFSWNIFVATVVFLWIAY